MRPSTFQEPTGTYCHTLLFTFNQSFYRLLECIVIRIHITFRIVKHVVLLSLLRDVASGNVLTTFKGLQRRGPPTPVHSNTVTGSGVFLYMTFSKNWLKLEILYWYFLRPDPREKNKTLAAPAES